MTAAGQSNASALFMVWVVTGPPSAGAYLSAGHSSPISTYELVLLRTHWVSVETSIRVNHFTLLLATHPGTNPRRGEP